MGVRIGANFAFPGLTMLTICITHSSKRNLLTMRIRYYDRQIRNIKYLKLLFLSFIGQSCVNMLRNLQCRSVLNMQKLEWASRTSPLKSSRYLQFAFVIFKPSLLSSILFLQEIYWATSINLYLMVFFTVYLWNYAVKISVQLENDRGKFYSIFLWNIQGVYTNPYKMYSVILIYY